MVKSTTDRIIVKILDVNMLQEYILKYDLVLLKTLSSHLYLLKANSKEKKSDAPNSKKLRESQ